MSTQKTTKPEWSPTSWKLYLASQQVIYKDRQAVDRATLRLSTLPPLVTSGEIERLSTLIAQAQRGERFFLQGGDCAETLADCQPDIIANKLKILLKMSLVLVHGLKKPVIRVGRFAGQYAKPRSSATETRQIDGQSVTLPSYFGDLVNSARFDPDARQPDPHLMVRGYQHAAMTLNFIRSLIDGGFADIHHPEYWDLSFFEHADLSPTLKAEYEHLSSSLADALKFMEALGEQQVQELARVEFFTSHEGLNLLYESAQTRSVPRRDGYYDLTTHLPWIGERTRNIDGAHIEFFRGITNPVGIKIGPTTRPEDLTELLDVLNPAQKAGRMVLITRMGAGKAAGTLTKLIDTIQKSTHPVLWVCDPMHGNMIKTASGIKTRSFDAILQELDETIAAHAVQGSILGGVHFELTGEDVTECVGGASGVTEKDLDTNYASVCDPRLNYQQSLEMAFLLSSKLNNKHSS